MRLSAVVEQPYPSSFQEPLAVTPSPSFDPLYHPQLPPVTSLRPTTTHLPRLQPPPPFNLAPQTGPLLSQPLRISPASYHQPNHNSAIFNSHQRAPTFSQPFDNISYNSNHNNNHNNKSNKYNNSNNNNYYQYPPPTPSAVTLPTPQFLYSSPDTQTDHYRPFQDSSPPTRQDSFPAAYNDLQPQSHPLPSSSLTVSPLSASHNFESSLCVSPLSVSNPSTTVDNFHLPTSKLTAPDPPAPNIDDSLIARLRGSVMSTSIASATREPQIRDTTESLAIGFADPVASERGRPQFPQDIVAAVLPDRPHTCRKCAASFRRRDNLMAHIRAQHKGERPFKCDLCGFRFIKKDHAMKHWKVVHLKERPFECKRCGSRFGQRSDLNKHVKSVHLKIKPFACEHCGLKFSHRGNQIRHQAVVHEKRKPYRCTDCDSSFAEKSNLLKHCQAVHKSGLSSPTMRYRS